MQISNSFLKNIFNHRLLIAGFGCLLVVLHYFIFSQFLPNANGKLGHDHSYNFPLLLDGYYWFLNNGFLTVPWFTPSFCGGMPLLANPATFYLSLPQLFSFFINPLSSIKLTFILFAGIGFWGFYWLLHRIFHTHVWTALLGGTLFLFNGFYAHRFIIGHMEFHSFMLVPLVAYLLIKPIQTERIHWRWHLGRDVIMGALLISYMFYSGMTQIIIPTMMVVILIGLIQGILESPHFNLKWFSIKFAFASIFSLSLSASKLVGALSFLSSFPRDTYLLPGVDGVFKLILLAGKILTFGGIYIAPEEGLSNNQWPMGRHEYEFGLTVVPFVIIGLGLLFSIPSLRAAVRQHIQLKSCLYLFFITFLLMIPLLLNFYSPAWNQVLKSIPIVQNLSNLLRWFIMYIPTIALLTAVAIEKSDWFKRQRRLVVLISIGIIIVLNVTTERDYYHSETYDPNPILGAYARTKIKRTPPTISHIIVYENAAGEIVRPLFRNDALINGHSQLLCYEPIFGFRLEFFPFKTIRPDPTLSANGEVLNLKNPACYLYPKENQCVPGDHFRVDQKQEAQKFINFRPFHYEISTAQKIANLLNLAALWSVILFGGGYCFFIIGPKIRKQLTIKPDGSI